MNTFLTLYTKYIANYDFTIYNFISYQINVYRNYATYVIIVPQGDNYMNNNTIKKYIEKINLIYSVTGVPIAIFNKKSGLKYCYPQLSDMPKIDVLTAIVINNGLSSDLPHYEPFLKHIDTYTFYAQFSINPDYIVIFGPAATQDFKFNEFHDNLVNKCPEDTISFLFRLINAAPSMNLHYFCNALILFTNYVFGQTIDDSSIHIDDDIENNKAVPIHYQYRYSGQISHFMSFDTDLYHFIKTGNTKKCKHFLEEGEALNYPYFKINDTMFLRIATIAYSAIASHNAVLGGAETNKISELFQSNLLKIMNFKTPQQYWEHLPNEMMKLCENVNASQQPYFESKIVKKCIAYINDHLYSKITIEDLVELTSASKRTIIRHFKMDLNVTPSVYIMNEKLKEAEYLLYDTDITIIEISNMLGFSSQSHFSKMFKQKNNCTPLQFRNNKKRTD